MSQHAISLRSLQVGRAMAATVVLAFHLSLMMGETRYGGATVFTQFTKHGYLGVDFFFVLSGFIIIFAHGQDIGVPGRWADYARRRFVRLFPIYWLYTGIFVLLVLAGFGTSVTLSASPLDILSSITLVRFSAGNPPLPVAWTLFHELAFYALFSVLILNVRAGIALFALWALLCVVFFHQPGDSDVGAASVYTAASNLYFLFGMGAYWVYRRGGNGIPEMLGGVALIGAAFVGLPLYYALARLVIVLGFALLLAGVTKLELAGRMAFPRWAVYVGDASYSIYLLHESLAGLLLKILRKTHLTDAIGRELTYLVVLGLTVALGCLAYAAVEKPLLGALRRRKPGVAPVVLPGDQRA